MVVGIAGGVEVLDEGGEVLAGVGEGLGVCVCGDGVMTMVM